MNSHFYNTEHIEAFLENKLSAADAASFKNAMLQDPLLLNEVDLQKEITETLKSHRKAELKSRLNKIEVSIGPSYLPAKIAASVLLSGLIGWGFYSYVNKEETKAISAIVKTETKVNSQDLVVAKNNQSENLTNQNAAIEDITSVEVKNKLANKSKKSENDIEAINTNSTSVPSGINFGPDDSFQPNENPNTPNVNFGQLNSSKSNLSVTVDKNTNNKFHYKYSENNLFLFGNFNSKTYEILELNTNKGKEVYLYYDNDYYYLKANQLEPTPLKKISDKKLIQELDKVNIK